MPRALAIFLLAVMSMWQPASAQACSTSQALGLARTIEIDTSNGPVFGAITKATKETDLLATGEVVLTFDDGPAPWITRPILDTLDQHCTKATFFSVGRMAIAYPESTREILQRGHTLGTHTWSHPLNIARLSPARARDEIERGFAAVAMAARQPIAPFFRFPGLSDSSVLLDHLQTRGIATFTVDVVSNDSYIGDPTRLTQLTLQRVEEHKGGIILFHDIKAATAKALPAILAGLKSRGYRVVHLRTRNPVQPVATYDAELGPMLAKAEIAAGSRRPLLPFYAAATMGEVKNVEETAVTRISPEARPRLALTQPVTAPKAATPARRGRARLGDDAAAKSPVWTGPSSSWEMTVQRPRRSFRQSAFE